MSKSWPSRVGLRDKTGKLLLFNPHEAVQSWEPESTLNCAQPISGYISPVICLMPSREWCLWDSSSFATVASRRSQFLSEEEAVQQILEWDLDLGPHAGDAVESITIGRSQPVGEAETNASVRIKPKWDFERRQLYYGETVIRNVAATAKNVTRILNAFEESGWPNLTDSPFPGHSDGMEKRREALRSLNRGLTHIFFEADGTGEGIRWRLLASNIEPQAQAIVRPF